MVKSLSCVPLDIPCPPKAEVQAKCTHGVTLDKCGECYECKKALGESCAGVWNMHGTCGDGLRCTEEPNQVDRKIGVCVPESQMKQSGDDIDYYGQEKQKVEVKEGEEIPTILVLLTW